MVAEAGMIPGEQQQIFDAEGGRSEQVGLQRHAVAVPAGHLQDGLNAALMEQRRHHQRRHAHIGPLIIRHIDGNHFRRETGRGCKHPIEIHPFGGCDFSRYHELPGDKFFCQFRHDYRILCLPG